MRVLMSCAAAAAVIAVTAAPASAVDYPVLSGTPTVDGLSAGGSVAPSTSLRIRGGGFVPGSEVVVTMESKPMELARTTADSTGFIDVTVRVPAGAPAGSHTLKATGPAVGGGTRVLAQPVVVASAAGTQSARDDDRLPRTGISATSVAALGVGGLAVGGGLILVARRRTA